MPKLFNLAKVTTATTGTGATIALGSAVDGFLTFADAGVADGDVVPYGIRDGSNSETGTAVYSSTGPTLTRTVTKSTNADAAINLSGTAQVFITARAEDIVNPVAAIFTGSIELETYTWTSTSGAVTTELDPANGTLQAVTLTGSITSLTDNVTEGEVIRLRVLDGAAYSISWPTMTWVNNGGSAPTLAPAASTVIDIWKEGGTLYGALVGDGT